jgi:four helix bundle protein
MNGNSGRAGHKDLAVWREGIALLAEVHLAVGRFPGSERDDLGDRIYRSALAVPSKIAEGQDTGSRPEFLEHLLVAREALAELGSLLVTAEQLGCLSAEELESLEQARANVANPLRGLIERVRRDMGDSSRSKPSPAS